MMIGNVKEIILEKEMVLPHNGNLESFVIDAVLRPTKETMFVSVGLRHAFKKLDNLPFVSGNIEERLYSSGGKYSAATTFERYAYDSELAATFLFEVVPHMVVALLNQAVIDLKEVMFWHSELADAADSQGSAANFEDEVSEYDDFDETEEDRETIFKPESQIRVLLQLLKDAEDYGFTSDLEGLLATFSKLVVVNPTKTVR